MPIDIREIIAQRGLEGAVIFLAEKVEKLSPEEKPEQQQEKKEPEQAEKGWQNA